MTQKHASPPPLVPSSTNSSTSPSSQIPSLTSSSSLKDFSSTHNHPDMHDIQHHHYTTHHQQVTPSNRFVTSEGRAAFERWLCDLSHFDLLNNPEEDMGNKHSPTRREPLTKSYLSSLRRQKQLHHSDFNLAHHRQEQQQNKHSRVSPAAQVPYPTMDLHPQKRRPSDAGSADISYQDRSMAARMLIALSDQIDAPRTSIEPEQRILKGDHDCQHERKQRRISDESTLDTRISESDIYKEHPQDLQRHAEINIVKREKEREEGMRIMWKQHHGRRMSGSKSPSDNHTIPVRAHASPQTMDFNPVQRRSGSPGPRKRAHQSLEEGEPNPPSPPPHRPTASSPPSPAQSTTPSARTGAGVEVGLEAEGEDEELLKKRFKNTLAARRSRAKKVMILEQERTKAKELEQANWTLQQRVAVLESEKEILRASNDSQRVRIARLEAELAGALDRIKDRG